MFDLNNIKVGDEVAVKTRDHYSIVKVIRVTKTLIEVPCNEHSTWKFSKKTGRIPGTTYDWVSTPWLAEITEEVKETILRDKLSAKIRNVIRDIDSNLAYNRYTLEQLQKLYDLVYKEGSLAREVP
jgi:hypothetical protein